MSDASSRLPRKSGDKSAARYCRGKLAPHEECMTDPKRSFNTRYLDPLTAHGRQVERVPFGGIGKNSVRHARGSLFPTMQRDFLDAVRAASPASGANNLTGGTLEKHMPHSTAHARQQPKTDTHILGGREDSCDINASGSSRPGGSDGGAPPVGRFGKDTRTWSRVHEVCVNDPTRRLRKNFGHLVQSRPPRRERRIYKLKVVSTLGTARILHKSRTF